MRFLPLLVIAVALSVTSGCRTMPFGLGKPSALDASEVPSAVASAEAALARDDAEEALRFMRPARESTGISPELRARVQVLLEQAASLRVDQLSGPESDPEDLADLVDLDLPRQIAVTAGLRAARRLYEQGDGEEAFELLQKLDRKFPLHHERQASGDLMIEIGLSLKDDDSGFFGLFETVDEAQEIFEYASLNAPWARRGDEGLVALAKIYENDREWDLAIDRAERLVLEYPASPLRPSVQAHIPHMRLQALRSPEYDRAGLAKALFELQDWLVTYPGHELEQSVRIDLADCLRRMSDNDAIVSRFYERVGNTFGARRHAERAAEAALEAGDEERAAAARRHLDSLPPAPPYPSGVGVPPR